MLKASRGAGGTRPDRLGEPAGRSRGNRSAGKPEAFLLEEVRTPSGKPGWGKIQWISCVFSEALVAHGRGYGIGASATLAPSLRGHGLFFIVVCAAVSFNSFPWRI